MKQVKQKMENENTNSYSVQMLAKRISEELCHNLLEMSISASPLTLPEPPPIDASEFEINPEESFMTSGPLSSLPPSQKKKHWS